jgi:hypothetical protein
MTHWKKLTNPDYLGAYALEKGQRLTLTIKYIQEETVVGPDGKKENCPVCHFAEKDVKPMILNATNMKAITALFGTPYVEEWANRQITVAAEKVKAFGEIVEALRVQKTVDKGEEILCEKCGKAIAPTAKMTASEVAKYTKANTGTVMCLDCAREYATQKKKQQEEAAQEINEEAKESAENENN